MLELSQLSAGYPSAPVLKTLDLKVEAGEMIAVLGRNGVGKSTLLKSIIGLLPVRSGSLILNGKDITRLSAHQRARLGIGYIPQGREIFSSLSVRENILTGQYRHRHIRSAEHNMEWLLDLFPMLAAKLNDRGDSLSGGQQQQLAIARALVSRPQILLLDEPSDGIQPNIVRDITEKLKDVNRRMGTTIILVEQNLEVVQFLAQQVYIMVKGEFVERLNVNQMTLDSTFMQEHLGV